MSRDRATDRVIEVKRKERVRQGPIQSTDIKFPTSTRRNLRFQASWFVRDVCGKFLEYSISEDAAFCFVCGCFGSLGK
jgi:hypothetical protein